MTLGDTVEALVSSIAEFPDEVTVFVSGTPVRKISAAGPGVYVVAKSAHVDVHLVASSGIHFHTSMERLKFSEENAGKILQDLVEDFLVGKYPGHIETDPPFEQIVKAAAEVVERVGPKWVQLTDALRRVMDVRVLFSRATGNSLKRTLHTALKNAFRQAPEAERLLTEDEWLDIVADAARTAYRHALVDAVDET